MSEAEFRFLELFGDPYVNERHKQTEKNKTPVLSFHFYNAQSQTIINLTILPSFNDFIGPHLHHNATQRNGFLTPGFYKVWFGNIIKIHNHGDEREPWR